MLPLRDGCWLRFNINLFLGETEKAPGISVMKVRDEVFEYRVKANDPRSSGCSDTSTSGSVIPTTVTRLRTFMYRRIWTRP